MPRFKDADGVIWSTHAKNDYGEENEEIRQMNIKDFKDGTHTFYNVSSGKQGVAFGNYRPDRDRNDQDDQDDHEND